MNRSSRTADRVPGRHDTDVRQRGRNSGWRLATSLVLIAACATGAAFGTGAIIRAISQPAGAGVLHDLRGNPVMVDPGTAPTPAEVKAMDPVTDTGDRLRVPSVGLDVPLGAVNAVDDQIVPPGFTAAYVVRNIGVTPAEADAGTVYVVMHSIRGGGVGPGNYLTDVQTQTSRVPVGAVVWVGNVAYTVTGSQKVSKSSLPSDTEVWQSVPDRVQLITCLELPSGKPSVDNLVISAVRSGTPAGSTP